MAARAGREPWPARSAASSSGVGRARSWPATSASSSDGRVAACRVHLRVVEHDAGRPARPDRGGEPLRRHRGPSRTQSTWTGTSQSSRDPERRGPRLARQHAESQLGQALARSPRAAVPRRREDGIDASPSRSSSSRAARRDVAAAGRHASARARTPTCAPRLVVDVGQAVLVQPQARAGPCEQLGGERWVQVLGDHGDVERDLRGGEAIEQRRTAARRSSRRRRRGSRAPPARGWRPAHPRHGTQPVVMFG